jgi:hypothetical protein
MTCPTASTASTSTSKASLTSTNNYRPHGALGGCTPNEYLNRTSQENPPSQMY